MRLALIMNEITLLIDASDEKVLFALLRKGEELFYDFSITDDFQSSFFNHWLIFLNQNKISLSSIDKLYLILGPGAYTPLRVAIMLAKTIAITLKRSLYVASKTDLIFGGFIPLKNIFALIKSDNNHLFFFVHLKSGYTKTLLLAKKQFLQFSNYQKSIDFISDNFFDDRAKKTILQALKTEKKLYGLGFSEDDFSDLTSIKLEKDLLQLKKKHIFKNNFDKIFKRLNFKEILNLEPIYINRLTQS